jgi:Zn-dependent protease/CBS domain-containing protein
MSAQVRLGSVFGVEIALHYSWFLVALLITFSLAGHFRTTYPEWMPGVAWTSALLTGMLFFVAIVVHELSHALVARRRGLKVRSIVLFALGGLARIETESSDARTEFWMGIAGPIASVLIAALCLGAAYLTGWDPASLPGTPALAVLVWLGYINLTLAVFNMIPGFPLDGGRVLRAAVWWATGDMRRATRVAARTGQVVAGGFVVLGLVRFVMGEGLGGLWIAFIGWFLLTAAGASFGQLELARRLRGLQVRHVMAREWSPVDAYTNLQSFVDEHLLRSGSRCFVVVRGGTLVGLVTASQVKAVPRSRWPYITVDEVMTPIDAEHAPGPETPLTESLDRMAREDLQELPVVSNGRVEGIVSRVNILQVLRTRADLGT